MRDIKLPEETFLTVYKLLTLLQHGAEAAEVSELVAAAYPEFENKANRIIARAEYARRHLIPKRQD